MQNPTKIIIQPHNQNLELEVDQSLLVEDLFEYIQTQMKINIDVKNWTCYSELKGIYLDLKSYVGNVQNDRLIINTQPYSNSQTGMQSNQNQQKFSQQTLYNQNHLQDQQSIYNQQIPTPQQQQINNQYQQSKKEQVQINSPQQNQIQNENNRTYEQMNDRLCINFQIRDGQIIRHFQSQFNRSAKFQELQNAVMAYLGVTPDVAICDLYICDFISKPYHLQLTLEQIQIKSNAIIEVRVRWFGGSIY